MTKIIPRSTKDLAWAAGFLEGEGSFGNYGSPTVTAAQVQREPLDRLFRLWGGAISQRKTLGFSNKPIWVWKIWAHRAAEVMMTLYVLMSPKRQREIEKSIARWKLSRLMKRRGTGYCGRGHPLEGKNIFMANGYVKCRECRSLNKRERRKRLRAGSAPVGEAVAV